MAKRHPSSRRRPVPEEIEPDDVFVARVVEATTWAQKHSQALILGVVVLAALVAAGWYYVNYRGRLGLAAVQELETIQQGASLADPAATETRLVQYIERFGATPLAGEARMMLASLYLDQDRAPEASALLEKAGVPVDEPLGPQVAVLLARAYEAQERWTEAVAVYLTVAGRAELPFQRTEALDDAARIRLEQGDAAGAAELYQRILDDLDPTDENRGLYEMHLSEARTRAGAGGER